MKRYLLILFGVSVIILTAAAQRKGGVSLPAGLEANFIQKVTNPAKKVIRYSGTVLMDRGNRFKWSYKKPTRKEVCSDGKRVIVVDHDLEQVSFYRLEKGFDLASVLRRARHYKDNLYTATYQGRIYTLAVDSAGRVEQIAYRDDMDNVVNIHLLKIRTSAKPPAGVRMECPYPENYDRIGG